MSNKLIADLMSFQARMKADARSSVMYEGDNDRCFALMVKYNSPPLLRREFSWRDYDSVWVKGVVCCFHNYNNDRELATRVAILKAVLRHDAESSPQN